MAELESLNGGQDAIDGGDSSILQIPVPWEDSIKTAAAVEQSWPEPM